MMPHSKWKTYLFWVLLSEITGLLSGLLTRDAAQIFSQTVEQPPLAPPALLFPVVWAVLYALMGISAARVSLQPASAARSKELLLFLIQLIVNFFWSPLFFNVQAFGAAFFWLILLWALVLQMIRSFQKIDPAAAYLQIPYLLWLTFAAYLSAGVWYLNR